MAKFRHGFVSNSSSSSFLLIAPKNNHDQVYKILTPYQKAVVDAMIREENVLGTKCVTAGYIMGQGGEGPFGYLFVEYDGEADEDGPEVAFDNYVEALKETGAVYTSWISD